jgi:hypothetical protein
VFDFTFLYFLLLCLKNVKDASKEAIIVILGEPFPNNNLNMFL